MDNKNNRGLFISLLFHIILLVAALNFKSADVLIPSRSDGMEVELISQPPQVVQREAPAKPTQYTVQNTNTADVKLKQPDTTPVPPATPKMQTPPKPTPTPKPKKKPTQDAQINDLLNDIVPSKGNSKGKATGGSNIGTSDTNNMSANYADLVIARVRPYVQIPDDIDSNIKVVVEVTLLPNMQVYKVRLVTPSGNDLYDSNVQQAINRVQTFPPLPDGANFSDFRKIKLTFKPQ